ncbi:MAG: hypothetical protein IKV85_03425 [Ruminococcus sp.]|nr:hypothetical protein [Ruminococcus sp.]
MIVLKILLWILLVLLGIVLFVLIMPVSVSGSYIGGKVAYSVKFAFLPVFNSKGSGIVNKLLQWRKKKMDAKNDEPKDEQAAEETSAEDITTVNEDISVETEEASVAAEEKTTENTTDVEETTETETQAEAVEAEEVSDILEQPLKPEQPELLEKTSNDEPEKPSKLEFILGLWEAADRPLLKIFKGIKISELYIDFFIANEDAYKCALNYGKISGTLYNIIAWLSVLFNVKLKTVDINPLFGQKKSQWDVSLKISLCLITMVIAGLQFLLIYLFRVLIPSKIQLKKAR